VSHLIGERAKQNALSWGYQGWVDRFPSTWDNLQSKWNLKHIRTINQGIDAAVNEVLYKGKASILKVFFFSHLYQPQLNALLASPQNLVPSVLEHDYRHSALLLEFIDGYQGEISHPSNTALRGRLQRTIQGFHNNSKTGAFPDLVEYHLQIADRCLEIDQAKSVLRESEQLKALNESQRGLVHGDLIPPNTLISKDKIYLIDPTGYRGDQAFDWASYALYAGQDDQLYNWIEWAAASSGYSINRLIKWALLRARLSYAQAIKRQEGNDSRHLENKINLLEAQLA
jgi:streptomycin 6-kinase